jgi:hypothetical protein
MEPAKKNWSHEMKQKNNLVATFGSLPEAETSLHLLQHTSFRLEEMEIRPEESSRQEVQPWCDRFRLLLESTAQQVDRARAVIEQSASGIFDFPRLRLQQVVTRKLR